MAKLIISDADGNERVHELVDDVTTLGRLSSNIVQIKDKEASRRHCQIERIPDGWRLSDTGSRNGVTVNGKKVKAQTLRPGDRVTIGAFSIIFVAPELETATEEELGSTVEAEPVKSDEEGALKVAPEPEAKPHYILEITEGRQRGKVVDMDADGLTIGRHQSNKLALDDESASNYHAEIVKEPTGYFLTDLGSTNGTQVNGEKIVKVRLSPGAKVKIGTTEFVFKNIGATSPEDEVFGTVVLDTDRLEKELAEDVARARALFIRRAVGGAVSAVVIGCLIWLLLWLVGRAGVPPPVTGNLIANSSFDQGLTERGDPLGWRKVGTSLTPWEVLTDQDRAPGRPEQAALRVSRSSEAALHEYTECRTREPIDVAPGTACRLGGWIRTAGAQGAYGVRVRWAGREGRSATDQVYVMGTQPEWREIKKVVTVPAWGAKAVVACFAYGNTGKIDFDDIYFAAVGAQGAVPSALLSVGSDRIRADFSPAGGFDVTSGTELAVTGGTLFIVGEDEAESTLEVAAADDPREAPSQADAIRFGGGLPELSRLEHLRYELNVRPGRSGVVLAYEISADHSLPLSRAGVRFSVTGTFAEGRFRAFDDEGAPAEGVDVPEDAQEVVFTGGEGEKLAVYLPTAEDEKPPRLRIEPRGEVRLVELLWPDQLTVGRLPARLAVEFNAVSRFARRPAEQAWKMYRTFKEQADPAAQVLALEEIVAMADSFPEDAEKARRELDKVRAEVDGEFRGLEDTVKRLGEAEGQVFKTLLAQATERLGALKEKYTAGEFRERVRKSELEIAGVREGRARRRREEEAEKILRSLQGFVGDERWKFAEAYLGRLEGELAETSAAKRAQEEGLRAKIEEGKRAELERNAAFESIKRDVDLFVRNGRFVDALGLLESNEKFPSLRGYSPFEKFYEMIRQGAEKEREEGGDQ